MPTSDAGLTTHYQRAAAFVDAVDPGVEHSELTLATDKGSTVISQL